jgi:hypothetical protein
MICDWDLSDWDEDMGMGYFFLDFKQEQEPHCCAAFQVIGGLRYAVCGNLTVG